VRPDRPTAASSTGASSHATTNVSPVPVANGHHTTPKVSVRSTHPKASARRTTHAPAPNNAGGGSTKTRATSPASTPARKSTHPATRSQQSGSTHATPSTQQLPPVAGQPANNLSKQTPTPIRQPVLPTQSSPPPH
jgi:hypothetical protein